MFGIAFFMMVIMNFMIAITSPDYNDLKVLEEEGSQLLHDHLMECVMIQYEARKDSVRMAIQSPEAAENYKIRIRESFEEILGAMPPKTPLNAQVTGVIDCGDYRIEKILYESRPDHHVTANLYIPSTRTGPFPGILVTCGHSMTAKARDTYQKVSILLAKNGFVVLIVDPIGQGERLQYAYSDNQNGLDATTRHTQLDIGSMLVGEDVVKYELWDNIRGIDYLCSRREVDAEKIGVTGHSGGGTQTMFAGAYDPRVAAAVPSCGLSERYGHFARLGPADGCYHLPNEGLRLLDNADYLIMAEDMPWLLLAAERDQYHDIDDVAFTFRESKWFYKLMSSIDRLDMYTVDSVHAFPCQSREAATWWFKRWLLNDNQPVIEPDLTIQQEKDLLVTQTGQVLTAFRNEKSIIDLNVDIANSYAKERTAYLKNLNRSDYLKMIKDASGYQEQNEPLRVQEEGVIDKKDYRVKKLVIQRENNIPLPALLCEPAKVKYPAEATIVIDSRGKNEEFGENGVITSLLKEGQMVLAVDLRGFGETRDDPGELRRGWRNWNIDHRIDQLSLHLGHPILIQRVEDAITALEYLLSLENIRDDRIRLFGIRDAGIIALHAVAFDDRIASVTVMNTVSSWLDIVKAPLAKDQLRNVVPGVLKYYDLPDLVELIQPRDVNILQPINLVSD